MLCLIPRPQMKQLVTKHARMRVRYRAKRTNKTMATAVSPSRPSCQDLMNALGQLSFDETKELVLDLGVTLKVVDDITASRHTEIARTRKRRCFQKWLDMDRDASWEKLISALNNIDKNNLAVEIENTRVRGIDQLECSPPLHSTTELLSILLDGHSWTATIVLCGSSGVGKTSLMTKFFHGCIPETHKQTIGVEDPTKSINVGGKSVRVQVLDMAGQKLFGPITLPYFKQTQAVILIYDITQEMSFNDVSEFWVEHIKENAPKNVEKVLVGNKIDLEDQRTVSREMGERLAKENDFKFFEASARSGHNVKEVFTNVVSQVMIENKVLSREVGTITVQHKNQNHHSSKPAKKSLCCLCCR